MKGPFAKIEQNLTQLLDQHLLSDIYAYREKRLARIAGIIDEMLDLSSHSSTSESMAWGIEELQAFSMDGEYDAMHEQIIIDIFVLKNELPEKVVFHQTHEHFEPLSGDDLRTKTLKRGKRLIRSMGKTEWLQKVPLQNVVAYHLLDSGWLFKDWLVAEERLLMQIILELDQVLDHAARDTADNSNNTELIQLLKVVQNEIEEAQRTHEKKLREARHKLMKMLVSIFSNVGTVERRAGFYNNNRISQKKEKTKQRLDRYAEQWRQINNQLLAKTTLMHQFMVLCDDVNEVAAGFKEKIEHTYDELFINPCNQLIKKIAALHKQIANSDQPLSAVLEQQEQQLSTYVNKKIVEPLQQAIEKDTLEQLPDRFAEELLQCVNDLPETAPFITDLERNEDPPTIKSRQVQWRMLVVRALKEHVLNPTRANEENIEDFSQAQLRETHEVRDIIEVNLLSALELSNDQAERDNPREVVDEALKRAQSKISACITDAQNAKNRYIEPLDEGLEQFRTTLLELLHHADVQKLKMLDAKYKVNEKTQGWRTSFGARWTRVHDRGAVLARFGWKKAKAYYEQSSTWLGLKQPEAAETKKADIAAYLTETERRFEELPFIYRRLFDFNAIPNERYYVGLNENFGYIQEALDHWQNGLSATMAVVGEKGSGKSTYVGLVASGVLARQKVLQISLDDTIWTADDLLAIFKEQLPGADCSSIGALVRFLNEEQEQKIIIFEGVQNLYMRQINGYDAIDQFVYLVAETSDDIFWLISCSRYAWSFLSKAVNINEYFSYLIETDTLDKQQVQKAIMSRHRASGYELVFASSEHDAKNRSYKKLKGDEKKAQEYLKEKYFKKLAELSDGNTSIAMIFWLRSIQKFDDTHCYIAPLEVASLETLEDLKPRTLFILASLVLHDTLHPEQLAVIQTMNAQESRMVLKRLKSRGIIVDPGHGYFLNHLMYRQVVDELKERNILHL